MNELMKEGVKEKPLRGVRSGRLMKNTPRYFT